MKVSLELVKMWKLSLRKKWSDQWKGTQWGPDVF